MDQNIKDAVRDLYGATARSAGAFDREGAKRVAAAFGYSPEELAVLPEGANLGLSCGNPTATARLRPGETVLDLGSGGGLDVFLAARAVGPTGRAIGLDMTQDMIDLARRNAQTGGHDNAEFVLGDIENMPVDTASVDCIISNCVINLCPDKDAAFREIFRVLRPGGRIAISDIALRRTLPDDLKTSLEAYVGCIAGAMLVTDLKEAMFKAGFDAIELIEDGADLNAYSEVDGQSACCAPAEPEPAPAACCGPSSGATSTLSANAHDALRETMHGYDLNTYAMSVKLFAVKPT